MRKATAVLMGLMILVSALAASVVDKRFLEGRPYFVAGYAKGYFIWHDGEGWHVRWTTKGQRHVFTGSIVCDGIFLHVKPESKEGRDFIKKTGENEIRFDAAADGGADGVDFRLSPSVTYLSFDLSVDGYRAAPLAVTLGRRAEHPAAVPFTVERNRK
jgi:hypothetical protein